MMRYEPRIGGHLRHLELADQPLFANFRGNHVWGISGMNDFVAAPEA